VGREGSGLSISNYTTTVLAGDVDGKVTTMMQNILHGDDDDDEDDI